MSKDGYLHGIRSNGYAGNTPKERESSWCLFGPLYDAKAGDQGVVELVTIRERSS